MTLSTLEVKKLAKLSKLHLNDDEIEKMKLELNDIVNYVEMLKEINVDDIEPMSHAMEISLPRRQDIAQKCVGKKAFSNSFAFEDGLVKVPKIIE